MVICNKCNNNLIYIKGKYNKYEYKCNFCKINWIYIKKLKGEQVYSNWRIDKNISWHNIRMFFSGLLYSLLTFEMINDKDTYLARFETKLWLPPVYANNYYEWKIK